jgi:hypothetical protein
MEYNVMHRAYTPSKGGRSVPKSRVINDLEDMAIFYIGTFSEYYPLDVKNNLVTYIRKDWTKQAQYYQKHIVLKGLELTQACSQCGGNVSNSNGVSFTKQDLFRISNAMDETDTLNVILADYIKDRQQLISDINITIK